MSGFPQAPVAIVPATCHYSWPKAGTLLGLGQNNILKVRVDAQARMHVPDLREKLRYCLLKRIPVIAVVAVIGSTEESAVDPLKEIIKAREDFRDEGLDFIIHCDAAWGGYFNSMNKEGDRELIAPPPEWPMNNYVKTQYRHLCQADSITVDPHKAGFVPYPAGALCYRNSRLRDFVSLAAPVVFHNTLEPTVGIYGIEGSKPGAAAAAVFLAHKMIRPNKTGYGKILGQCMWVSKRLYCRLLTMHERGPQPSPLKVVPFQVLPAHRPARADDVEWERRTDFCWQYTKVKEFVDLSNAELRARLEPPSDEQTLFNELGSDQVIVAYAFNFVDPATGRWNECPEKANELNNEIFEICSITKLDEDLQNLKLIITCSEFDAGTYGSGFVDDYARRLGLRNAKNITFLISTTMNPWASDTPGGNFLKNIEDALREAFTTAVAKLGFAKGAAATR
jgi:hypothetical protein